MNCPACGYFNPTEQQTCFHCALPLPIPAGDACCAVHPEVKATGACSRCGTFGCGSCLSARGTDWLCTKCWVMASRLPWDERETLGLWRAWWRTCVMLMSNPTQALSTAEPDAPLGSSVLFALLSGVVAYGPTLAVMVPLAALGGALEEGTAARAGMAVGVASGAMLFYLLLALFLQLGGALFIPALDHLGLMMLGANPRSYTVTVRAHALSTAPQLLGLFPFCSFWVYFVWSLVLRVLTNMHLHKTSAGKATAAVLLPVLLFCGGLVAFYLAVIALAMSAVR